MDLRTEMKAHMSAEAAKLKRLMAQLQNAHNGKPVDELIPIVSAAWSRTMGSRLSDNEARDIAEAVSSGGTFTTTIRTA